jgi:magnesium chelatase family protein
MKSQARVQLVAAMNPCPCGFHGDAGRCRCSSAQRRAYLGRISGPLLDRIDLHIEVPRVEYQGWRAGASGESSAVVAARVAAARLRQRARSARTNAALDAAELERHAPLTPAADRLLASAAQHFGLSARGCQRVIRVARTIADLAAREQLIESDVAEALDCRRFDRVT